ncbi:hypothetical protein POM88_017278 [Heracleum sosnowskyi]|uniref:Uncharacterized protein n=1 Tax=Heracleum sosnowskyi TaxID=360622 RepID=A0AAD8MTS3_9APIA|nr:hypothetical protein POM88_017278 [Heracleum sosnowskyi]
MIEVRDDIHIEKKIPELLAGGGGWDKGKRKRKPSSGAPVSRRICIKRKQEHKQQRISIVFSFPLGFYEADDAKIFHPSWISMIMVKETTELASLGITARVKALQRKNLGHINILTEHGTYRIPEIRKNGKIKKIKAFQIQPPRDAPVSWYTTEALQKIKEHGVIYLIPFLHRLAEEIDIRKLRTQGHIKRMIVRLISFPPSSISLLEF